MSKAKKIIISILGSCLVAFSGITVLAATTTYNMTTQKPDTDSYSCYLEIDTAKWGGCVVWCRAYSLSGSFNSESLIFTATQDTTSNQLKVSVTYPLSVDDIYVTGFLVNSQGYVANMSIDSEHFNAYISTNNMGNITNVNAYNCKIGTGLSHTGAMTFTYGSDTLTNDLIKTVNSLISVSNNNTALTASRLESLLAATYACNDRLDIIYGVIDELENNTALTASRLESLLSAMYANNTRLDIIYSLLDEELGAMQANDNKNTQAVIDNQNQIVENEKTETQNSGNNSVNDVSGSVPDKSAGMLSALQSLSNAVSYTGTSAKWTFPQMYIPAIAGVTDRINLNPEMEINFTYWVNQIPEDIMTLISALATIGLVIFAFKELYGLISYVLTLKGGGNNE